MSNVLEYAEALKRLRERRERLAVYTRKVFETLNPGQAYLHNWHIDYMSELGEAFLLGQIPYLAINVQPRSLKSILCSVALPTWAHGHDPTLSFMCASYAQDLSYKHSQDRRDIMRQTWYQAMFPDTRLSDDQQSKGKYKTTRNGQAMATSVGASSIGEGGRFLIMDDPINPNQALSVAKRDSANAWFDQSFYTRLNDKKLGGILLVMQRLNELDVTGHVTATGDWMHVKIPTIAPEPQVYVWGGFRYERAEGELLHEEREGKAELEIAKRALGSYGFAGQYQQSPFPAGGGLYKTAWWKWWKELSKLRFRVIQSWDTAYKEKEQNDYSVCTTWLEGETGYYLLDMWRGKLMYPDLKRMMLTQYDKHNPDVVIVEDKASGQSLVQDLQSSTKLPIIAIKPEGDKIARANSVVPTIEAGNVHLPEGAEWMADYMAEFEAFPNGAHDDIVDSVNQGLLYLKRTSMTEFDISGVGQSVAGGM